MVANPSKFQLMLLSKYKNLEKIMSVDGKIIKSLCTVELHGITLDKKINFKRHMQNICHKGYVQHKIIIIL